MEDLDKLKIILKQELAPDFLAGLVNLRNHLKPNSKKFDELIGIHAKYARIMDAFHSGIITFQDAEIELNKVFVAAIYVINNLRKDDMA